MCAIIVFRDIAGPMSPDHSGTFAAGRRIIRAMHTERTTLPLAWTCTCQVPPLVLARFNLSGSVAFEHQERYWLVNQRMTTNCPGCGKQHRLELELSPDVVAMLHDGWNPDLIDPGKQNGRSETDRPGSAG